MLCKNCGIDVNTCNGRCVDTHGVRHDAPRPTPSFVGLMKISGKGSSFPLTAHECTVELRAPDGSLVPVRFCALQVTVGQDQIVRATLEVEVGELDLALDTAQMFAGVTIKRTP